MRFLYSLLAAFWILFGWMCVLSMQWQPPAPTPMHAARALRHTNLEEIDKRIEEAQMIIADGQFKEINEEEVYYWLAGQYWLKAFFQDKHQTQEAFLRFALAECQKALNKSPDNYRFLTLMADIQMALGDLDEAERLYLQALERVSESSSLEFRRIIDRRLNYLSQYKNGLGDVSDEED